MATKRQRPSKAGDQDSPSLKEKRAEARLKMFIRMLDIKSDSNMTRYYSAIRYLKTT